MVRKALAKLSYLLLVLAGIAFTITACGYTLLAVRASPQYRRTLADQPTSPMVEFLSRHGDRILASELAVLLASSVAAVAAHGKWRSAAARRPARAGSHAASELSLPGHDCSGGGVRHVAESDHVEP